ncbi:MAG: sensor histidine kinase [Paenibacillaceae bacterium]|jgi:two-component system sensor histidine kinase YesM|nr:sensor histidine kinase [Paenibacillaceae bacterium]
MNKIKDIWYRLKLRFKFLLSYALVIVISVMTISIIAYQVSSQAINQMAVDDSRDLIEQIGLNIDKRMSELEEYVFAHYKNSGIVQLLPSDPELPADNPYVIRSGVLSFMDDFLYSRPFITTVMIRQINGDNEFIRRTGAPDTQEEMEASFDEERMKAKRGQVLWLPGSNQRIYMQRAMYNVETSALIGYISIGIEEDYLSEFYKEARGRSRGQFILLNENNELLMNSSRELQRVVDKLAAGGRLDGESTSFELKDNGEAYLFTLRSFSDGNWKLLNRIAVSELTKPAQAMKYGIIIACLLSFFAALLMAVYLSKGITGNVKLLLGSMKGVSEGRFDQLVVTKSKDEIGQLAHRFNLMTQKVNELITVVYKEKLLKEQAEHESLQFEYKALQAQMNPHFLYNTLESIQSLALLQGEKKISDMVYLLGSLLRESIRQKNDVILLREELQYVVNYLEIQQIMYDDQLEVIYELDEALLCVPVPKLILQPIVENAILHGIEKKPGKGIIHIRCFAETTEQSGGGQETPPGVLRVEVQDNGVGMEPAVVQSLLAADSGGEEGDARHTRVGIGSVNKRIKILYGASYGVMIESETAKGSLIAIRLPIVRNEEGGETP